MVGGLSTKKGTTRNDFFADQFFVNFIRARVAENQLDLANILLGRVQVGIFFVLSHADWFREHKQPSFLGFVSPFNIFVVWRPWKGFPNNCPFELNNRRLVGETGWWILGMKSERHGQKCDRRSKSDFDASV